jgi:hypothetical protein
MLGAPALLFLSGPMMSARNTLDPLSLPQMTAAALDAEQDAWLSLVCPMCHTATPLTQSAVKAGANCGCVKCGQRWDAIRLLTVAAYTARVADRGAAAGKGAEPVSLFHSVRIEQRDGKT